MGEAGSEGEEALARVLRGAVDALPEGRLAEQLESGKELRVKFGMDPTSPTSTWGTRSFCRSCGPSRTLATRSS